MTSIIIILIDLLYTGMCISYQEVYCFVSLLKYIVINHGCNEVLTNEFIVRYVSVWLTTIIYCFLLSYQYDKYIEIKMSLSVCVHVLWYLAAHH
jgi:hypothetical protein